MSCSQWHEVYGVWVGSSLTIYHLKFLWQQKQTLLSSLAVISTEYSGDGPTTISALATFTFFIDLSSSLDGR